ncbi:MAG: hypothetical protein A3E82_03285 [Gammaproteobacteria bacterium RIFCSPHIGHO2_12_FULL_38_11]|nr:MAG: hypothetical protein A3E82_03285 [Gammaproteobacteria bacterium RIFCSPHIGHO2_12_FULL_38_11]
MKTKILTASLICLASFSTFAKTDWVNTDGNPAYTKSLDINTNPKIFHILWKVPVNSDPDTKLFLTWNKVIADNIYFSSYSVDDKKNNTIKSIMNAIDTQTGKTIWSDQRHNFINLQYNNNMLLEKVNNHLFAFNPRTGELRYEKILDPYYLYDDFQSDDNQIYFSSVNLQKFGNLDGLTGDVNWTVQMPKYTYRKSNISFNDQYIVTRFFDELYLFDRTNGAYLNGMKVRDIIDPRMMSYQPVTLDKKTAYLFFQDVDCSDYCSANLYAIDLNQFNIKWVKQKQFINEIVLSANMVFSVDQKKFTEYQNQRVNAINAETGVIEWSWKIPSDDTTHFHAPYMVATSDILFVAGTKHLFAISLATHDVVWQGDFAATELALGDNKLFFMTKPGEGEAYLHALALS